MKNSPQFNKFLREIRLLKAKWPSDDDLNYGLDFLVEFLTPEKEKSKDWNQFLVEYTEAISLLRTFSRKELKKVPRFWVIQWAYERRVPSIFAE